MKIKLELEPKNKYTMVPSGNPKAQILYEECHFGDYIVLSDIENDFTTFFLDEEDIWRMEFDGSCSNLELGEWVLLFHSNGECIIFCFKLDFRNTNNTAKYEALLLGLEEAKLRGIKKLVVKGDVELIVKHVRGKFSVKNEKIKAL